MNWFVVTCATVRDGERLTADAMAKSHKTKRSLHGSPHIQDVEKAVALAKRLDAPFAGAKQSEIGGESSEESLFEFTQLQVVNVKHTRPDLLDEGVSKKFAYSI